MKIINISQEISLEKYVEEAKKHFDSDMQEMFKGWMENLVLKKYRNVIESHPDPRIYVGIAEVLKRVADAKEASQFLTSQLSRRFSSLSEYLGEVEKEALDEVTKKFPESRSEILEVYKSI